MPTMILPDKICPHCGGNKWYARPCNDRKGLKYTCSIKRQEYSKSHKPTSEYSSKTMKRYRERNPEKSKQHVKKWRDVNKDRFLNTLDKWRKANIERVKENKNKWLKKQVAELSDFYIRTAIANQINQFNRENNIPERVKPKTISQEVIEKYREGIKKIRVRNQKIKEMNKGVTTKEMTAKEKKAVYMKRYHEKKKSESLQSVAEYENVAAIGVEEPVVEQKLIIKQEFQQVPTESIFDEFKRIEARRNEILYQTELLNNYIETLKIKLV